MKIEWVHDPTPELRPSIMMLAAAVVVVAGVVMCGRIVKPYTGKSSSTLVSRFGCS